MTGFIEGISRDQTTLFPERLDDWITEDHLARVVDIFVEELDLAALGFHRHAAARTGRPGYHPSVLLKLFSRWEHEHLVEASNARRRGPTAPMRVRRSTVEHPFGTIKAWMGNSHFLTRGLKGVSTEMALNVLAYNMKRMISLIGIRGLMGAIPG